MADFQFAELAKPGTNLLAGAWYLGRLLHRYRHTDNPAAYALAAYNAGPTTASRWATGAGATNSAVFLRQMTYPGTRQYVEAVLRREERYRRQLRRETMRTGLNHGHPSAAQNGFKRAGSSAADPSRRAADG
jgi:soluble lytic murein transglycosylase-like protein